MYAQREFIDVGSLATQVEDTDFGIGHTTVEAGFWVRLAGITMSANVRVSEWILAAIFKTFHSCHEPAIDGPHKSTLAL